MELLFDDKRYPMALLSGYTALLSFDMLLTFKFDGAICFLSIARNFHNRDVA